MNEQVKTGSYDKFNDAMSTVDKVNSDIEDMKTKVTEYCNSLNNESVFMGPICDSCVNVFGKLKSMLDLDTENYNTIKGYLNNSLTNYQDADAKAMKFLSIKDNKIIETTQPISNNQTLADSLYNEIGKRSWDYSDSPNRFHSGEWCADFVSYMLRKNGYNYKWSSYCGEKESYSIFHVMKENGAKIHYDQFATKYGKKPDTDYVPQAGDVCLLNVDSDSSVDHVGIVIKDNGDGTVTTIEGNTSKKGQGYDGKGIVEEKIRSKKDVYGYATPSKETYAT